MPIYIPQKSRRAGESVTVDPHANTVSRPQLALPLGAWAVGRCDQSDQLFAGGYAACLEMPLLQVSRGMPAPLCRDDIDVVARIDRSRNKQ